MWRELLLVAVGARQRVLAAEILDVAEPVAEDALRQPASEMRTDPPEDHADLVLGVVFDGQAANHHETAPILDLVPDLVDHRPQRRNFEMLAPQVIKAEAFRFYLPDDAYDFAQMGRVELDRVICRRLEIGNLPGARVIDRRSVQRRQRRIDFTRPAYLAKLTHRR